MDRRAFLTSAASVAMAASAGCLGTQASGEDKTPTEDRAVDIVDVQLIHEGEGADTEVRAEITAEAVADQTLGEVVATATFVDGETLLGSWVAVVNGMEPGQRWLVSIRSGGTSGEDAAAVDDVQVVVEERSPASTLGSDRIEIVDEDLIAEDGEARVEGVARNAGEERLEYATVVVTFASEDGVLLGQALTDTTRDIDVGQQFEFSVRYSAPVRAADAVADYQLTTEADIEK
ncbi:FxLYD domain-containing protein [Halorhabdus amylolytica]|uniref:FxLYD domain-containing protein n=1 Tax=Halorhabdus amylolytica TaxID=2559573 RepID=UPI0010A9E026|nr:FxLYD domain-containing protein [Halorhabdus amylolytica]